MKFVLAACLMVLALPAAAQPAPVDGADSTRYRVESAVWCSGELRGEPELLLQPGVPGVFEVHSPDSSWRLSVEVEPPGEAEGAPDALWFKVGIEQQVDGRWEFLTDTMLGTPLGRPGVITVVEEGEQESGPETAPLYIEMTASRVEPVAGPEG
ncbi:MAG: hypothetical protein CMP07_10125 [Xanthomonadales bacterium]|nr:hypothetical protein [Xanthomonadales bacterium]